MQNFLGRAGAGPVLVTAERICGDTHTSQRPHPGLVSASSRSGRLCLRSVAALTGRCLLPRKGCRLGISLGISAFLKSVGKNEGDCKYTVGQLISGRHTLPPSAGRTDLPRKKGCGGRAEPGSARSLPGWSRRERQGAGGDGPALSTCCSLGQHHGLAGSARKLFQSQEPFRP